MKRGQALEHADEGVAAVHKLAVTIQGLSEQKRRFNQLTLHESTEAQPDSGCMNAPSLVLDPLRQRAQQRETNVTCERHANQGPNLNLELWCTVKHRAVPGESYSTSSTVEIVHSGKVT